MKGGILVLGRGYIGEAFIRELHATDTPYVYRKRAELDYTQFRNIRQLISDTNPSLVVNCAAYLAGGTVSNCDNHKAETLAGNAIFPSILANACEITGTPLMHISTGCLYDEQREYDETDLPLRGFDGHCGTYVGSKIMAEELVSQYPSAYILRIRLPFDEFNNPRNYLNKIKSFTTVYDHVNSLTHRGDFVKQALELWRVRAPFGIYNMACAGQIEAWDVLGLMIKHNLIKTVPGMGGCASTTGSRLSVQKLIDTGIKVRHVEEAVDEAIRNYA